MFQANRRTTLRMLGGAALTATAVPVLSHRATAQQDDLVVPNRLENFKRGTIHIIHPPVRSFSMAIVPLDVEIGYSSGRSMG